MTDWKTESIELLRLIAGHLEAMADALEQDDGIMGSLAGMGLANHLPLLPSHIRHVLIENLDDEAARGARAETLYMAEMYPEPVA